ncbi:MAG: YlmC/YmxH family sporulation protein [Clostridia bacterium]|nr:YlmC/YmxH family sporulation protein [Clostridia bacterium]
MTTFSELRNKQVINIRDGSLLGCVCDLELNSCTGEIRSIVLPGNGLLASLSAKNRIVIPWCDIERIGRDTILVKFDIDFTNKNTI